MQKLIIGFVLVALLVIAAVVAWWWFEGRWRPKTITKHQTEIAQLLEASGWVSPGLTGPRAYIVMFRSCPDCVRYKEQELPKLLEGGVDARVVMIARADVEGQAKSTPAERATVAELWLNRNWPLMERWDEADLQSWTAEGIHPADGDMARTAVIQAGRSFVDDLKPLLKDNGVDFRYPTVIWWAADGTMKACACEDPRTYHFVRKDLVKR